MSDPRQQAGDWSRASGGRFKDLARVFTSRHCRDLVVISIVITLVVLCCGGFIVKQEYFADKSDQSAKSGATATVSNDAHMKLGDEVIAALVSIAGLVTTGVWAWAFQQANLRFGAADLFASEITTLCRIAAVIDFMPRLIAALDNPHQALPSRHPTQDYTAIFSSNSKDLEVLDGQVVTSVAEFYVTFKGMWDTFARIPDAAPAGGSEETVKLYKQTVLNAIYMGFLTYESGRHALQQLIDDRELREGTVLTALMSEIPAYIRLYQEFNKRHKDIRWKRISGRLPGYQKLMRSIGAVHDDEGKTSSLALQNICELAKELSAQWTAESGTLKQSPNS